MAGWGAAKKVVEQRPGSREKDPLKTGDDTVNKFFLKNEEKKKKMVKLSEGARRKLKARKQKLITEALKAGNPMVSMKQVLADIRLSKYYPLFRDSNFDVVEHYSRKTDIEVEELLATVEKMTGTEIPYAHRVRIFKAIRMRWFADPSRVRPYVDTDALPRLYLGKRDHRHFDADMEYSKIESERQRQICRKMERTDEEDSKRQQFEVRHRHPDHYYELRDVQRCIQEWRGYDPRRMLREDPREEYFMQRLRILELRIAKSMQEEKKRESRKGAYLTQLKIFRILFLVAFAFLMSMGFSSNRDKIPELMLSAWLSSNQMMSGIWFFVASQFAYGVATHKKQNLELQRAQKMHNACKKMNAAIVTFRLDSAAKRVDKYEDIMEALAQHFGVSKRKKIVTASAEELAAQGFDAWFEDIMSKPFSKYDAHLEMNESFLHFPADPMLAGTYHPKDGINNKHAALIAKKIGQGVQEHTRAANPTVALQASEEYFNEEDHRDVVGQYEEMRAAMERLVRAERGDSDSEEASSESGYGW